ncbi:MAG: nucleotide exchange factor GrpE [Bacteroidales bacterium]
MNKNEKDMNELNEQNVENCNCQNDENCNCTNENECQNEAAETDNLAVQLEEVKAKNEELNDQYLRLLADYDNYRKRTLREKSELIKNGGESALTALLPVIDDFERAIANIDNAKDLDAVKEGVQLIYGKFANYLTQNNVSVIETEEMPFDTDLHDAITTIPAPAENLKGKVVDCVQKGYKLNDKVIRFAKVVVGE